MPVPFKVKAVYEYKSDEPDDLNFSNGQVITVTEEDDADWYTGEYNDASGQKHEGIFPRNFVEKYEPAVPSRPVRARPPPQAEANAPEPVAASSTAQPPQEPAREDIGLPQPAKQVQPTPEPVSAPKPNPEASDAPTPQAASKIPPAVVNKPSSNAFKDRIAAFNKPAAAPITPFKPGGSSVVKKPFVPAPPSRDSYVPPPNYQPPQKISRAPDESSETRNDGEQPEIVRSGTSASEGLPKPTSLKDRIALLQQQQLEQAQRSAEKKKPKKPSTQRLDSAENVTEPAPIVEAPLSRQATGDTLNKRSIESSRLDEPEARDIDLTTQSAAAISTTIPPPSRELVSDTNDADDSGANDTEDAPGTSTEEDNLKPTKAKVTSQSEGAEEEDAEEEEDDAEDEDPEVRRRRELRERMAKMSGGMGMMGMFGGGMPTPSRKPKAPSQAENRYEEPRQEAETQRAPPVPVMPLPGMAVRSQPPEPAETETDSETDEEAVDTPVEHEEASDDAPEHADPPHESATERSLPSKPTERLPPPPPPRDFGAPPVPSSSTTEDIRISGSPISHTAPSLPSRRTTDVDDSFVAYREDDFTPTDQTIARRPSVKLGSPPPVPGRSSTDAPLTSISDKRASRPPPPPVPGNVPTSAPARAPPPPPPGQPPSRTATRESLGRPGAQGDDEDSEAEITEYDGDYDTDIASGAKHKAALRSHNRQASLDEDETFTDDAAHQSPVHASRALPPPPPPPQNAASRPPQSTDVPRSVPPPIPISRPNDDVDYDPFRYSAPPVRPPQSPPLRSPVREVEEEDMYGAPSPPLHQMLPPPPPVAALPPVPPPRDDLPPPPPPPSERAAPPPPPLTNIPPAIAAVPAPPGMSTEIPRQSIGRHSMEAPRPSTDYGFMATDLDLSMASRWWMQDNTPPPSLHARNDVLYEIESSSSTKRGGKTTVSRDVYVLYQDLSQTTVNVTFDSSDPAQPSISQSHQRPPLPPRQDQLESASSSFGSQIVKAANSASGSVIGDSSAYGLIHEALTPLKSTAIMPIGQRVFGALVYANLGNASTQQFDEIRSGDIVTFRNAKFAGHRGGLHAKYSMDVGKPDHVGIVIDWDGTKKKIRAWEQGREEKGKKSKVREESFRIADLKSGEVRVWRVMPRSWVGWE